jgi:hypothetical protein
MKVGEYLDTSELPHSIAVAIAIVTWGDLSGRMKDQFRVYMFERSDSRLLFNLD